jgi:hypothetical protein
MFPPNPVPSVREGRPAAYKRYLKVTGPKEVGGVLAPGWLTLDLTDAQLEALQAGGHVVDYPAGAGWGSDSSEDAESDADGPAGDAKPEPKDEPKAGADKEGN